uniref:Uncharacterized protein n=1 Tax=Timema bartmani TaxID=61472 RepID=A0A7R9F295_9NEOP|nr:unnamed protein product [Timema bartmani]
MVPEEDLNSESYLSDGPKEDDDDDGEFVPSVKSPWQLRIKLKSTALTSDRYGVADRATVASASSLLQDIGVVSNSDYTHIVDKNKLRREKECNRTELQVEATNEELKGIYFDGRKDKTLNASLKLQLWEVQKHIISLGESQSSNDRVETYQENQDLFLNSEHQHKTRELCLNSEHRDKTWDLCLNSEHRDKTWDLCLDSEHRDKTWELLLNSEHRDKTWELLLNSEHRDKTWDLCLDSEHRDKTWDLCLNFEHRDKIWDLCLNFEHRDKTWDLCLNSEHRDKTWDLCLNFAVFR